MAWVVGPCEKVFAPIRKPEFICSAESLWWSGEMRTPQFNRPCGNVSEYFDITLSRKDKRRIGPSTSSESETLDPGVEPGLTTQSHHPRPHWPTLEA
ncbi:hypothetical protein FQN54_009866 [Arachnomyces sp. PD_36]|nr:hypothetical protein FQN54_009866 [Arachnomyces sp. PD_36]